MPEDQIIEKSYPLSCMQQGMLFHTLSSPHSGQYIQQLICELNEQLDHQAFRKAAKQIVRRHPILRTAFSWPRGDEPQQHVYQNARLPWKVNDLQKLSPRKQKEVLQSYLDSDRKRGFVVEEAPLTRFALFRFGKRSYRLIWTSHHALMDGRSRFLMLKELFALYEAFKKGQDIELKLSRPFGDYIAWLSKQNFDQDESFWHSQLEGFTSPTRLYPDSSSLTEKTQSFGKQEIRFSKSVTSAMKAFVKKHQLSLSTLLQSAWAILLSIYGGQQDIVFGATRACRHSSLEEAESMVGLFINTLPVRVKVESDLLLLPWLKQFYSTWNAMRNHEHTPLVKLQGWSNITAGTALFETVVVFENYALNSALRAFGKNWKKREFRLVGSTNYPLVLAGYSDTKLLMEITYDRCRFADETITRMLKHLQIMLKKMIRKPEQRLSELEILPKREHDQVLFQWNETATPYPSLETISGIFQSQTEQTPDAVAVIFDQEELSYRQLNNRANQLAHYLKKLDLGPEALIGVCMERSTEMVVALLGILKAGAAYLPLNPEYPVERLSFTLKDTGAPLLISQQHLLNRLPQDVPLLCLDSDWNLIADENQDNPLKNTTAENLAYVIYTSGSTGTAKGVCISHQGVVRLVTECDYAALTARDVFLQFAPISFDASTFEIWGALLNGGKLVIAPPHIPSLTELAAILERYQITILWLTAGLFHLMVESHLESLKKVRQILAGGDVLSAHHVRKLFPLKGCTIINGYGPTEGTTFTCCYRATDAEKITRSVPIGRPIANTEVYILSHNHQAVPIGVPGELYIGGDGLARCYLNHSDLTAENFVPNPFSGKPGTRLYKTGDLARYLPDGNIEFLGRLDDQVKIRGYRVEPGEIEATLCLHPHINNAAVAVQTVVPGDKRLFAYLVTDQNQDCSADEFRKFLKQKLPDYMIPADFVFVELLPLTANGKVDRKALLPPEKLEKETAVPIPYRTPHEEIVTGIWSDVLKRPHINIHDNFFELGGHSLLAIQILSRLEDSFGVKLSLASVFEMQTIEALAKCIQKKLESSASRSQAIQSFSEDRNLSFSQQRFWFLEQLMPGSCIYNVPAAKRLRGSLNLDALKQSLNEIVRRHESLRITFSVKNGEPFQVIHEPQPVKLTVVDLSRNSVTERNPEVARLAREEVQSCFDLKCGPLFRITLFRIADDEHILLATVHHSVFDGWSLQIFFRELAVLYEAYCSKKLSPLPELKFHYSDFTSWQKQLLRSDAFHKEVSYWRQQLSGSSVTELRTDHQRPLVQTFNGSRQSILLPETLTKSLKVLSRHESVTLFMTTLAAFKLLLARYTSEEDIVVLSPIAERNRLEFEGLIGCFLNILVLRTKLSGNPNFRQVLKGIREVCLGAYAHRDIPFEKLVEQLQVERNLSHSPFSQIMFQFLNIPENPLTLQNMKMEPFEFDTGLAKIDLTVDIVEKVEGLQCTLRYNSDLFEQITIQKMLLDYQTLLEEVVANPGKSLSDISRISSKPKAISVSSGSVELAGSIDVCIHRLFEAQVKRTPHAVALVCGENQLTFQELNRRANQLAHLLQKLKIAPEIPVAIYMERSLQTIVALLGILKAGGCYLPLPFSAPRERLALILEDARAPVVITKQRYVASLPDHEGRLLLLEGNDWESIADQKDHNPFGALCMENLAYLIYTSGTTGKPKGVLIEHRSLQNYALAICKELELKAPHFAMVQPLSVDSSVTAIFPPLITGGCLHVITEEQALDENALADYFTNHQIDSLKIAPSHLESLLKASSNPTNLLRIDRLVIGGESSRWDWIEKLQTLASQAQIFTHYGPTEATVGVTTCRLEKEMHRFGLTVPIGRPLGNTQIYVLNRFLHPVPPGIEGELFIGGAPLARGYFNLPNETAQNFIPDPFSSTPGARLYKTGDLVRCLADGNLEFLGRIDQQIKIRGFRVEQGEIETVLRSHPGVSEAVVTTHQNDARDKQLVTYIVPKSGQNLTKHELRNYLKEKLPDFMIPAAFVTIDSLPRSSHGKLDLRALPPPNLNNPESSEDYIAPRTSLEEKITSIWSEVLCIERIGIRDNFFQLGGHSLMAVQVVARIREAFGTKLSVLSLFERPTIEDLAEIIQNTHGKGEAWQRPAAAPFSKRRTLSFSQQGLWFLQQLTPELLAYNTTVARRLKGRLNLTALQKTISEIVRRHEALRTTFSDEMGEPFAVIHDAEDVNLEIFDVSDFPANGREAELSRLIKNAVGRPFDLVAGPLYRPALFRVDEHDHLFIMTVHHIVFDAWSMKIFLRELALLYEAFSKNKPSPLPDLTLQFSDFAERQRRELQGDALRDELSYWKHQLLANGKPVSFELPTDHARPAIQTFPGSMRSIALPKTLTDSLKMFSRREKVTLFMTLLAGFQALLYRYTGQKDVVIGAPIAGRNSLETENLIGYFINTLVLRTDFSGNPNFLQILARVRNVCLGAYAHQNYPLENLAQELQPKRDLSRMPFFQISFQLTTIPDQLLNLPTQPVSLPDLTMEWFDMDTGFAKFDLAVAILESSETLRCYFRYNTDLFEESTIVRMMEHFQGFLQSIAANPEGAISELALMTDSPQKALEEWNNTNADYPNNICVHQLFEAQVERTPEAVALAYGEDTLTYSQLNAKANQVAHFLRKCDVRPETVVGVYLNRSLKMMIALLGILKAGGAYAPIHADEPMKRMSYMIKDTGMTFLLSEEKLSRNITDFDGHIIYLDSDWNLFQKEKETNLETLTLPEGLAYVMYTSGSTGRPKGTLIAHQGVVNYLSWLADQYALSPSDIVLQNPSISFDASVRDIFGTLVAGAKLVLVSETDIKDPAVLLRKIKQQKVTCLLSVTPPLLEALIERAQKNVSYDSVRLVLASGDPLSMSLCQKVKVLFGNKAIVANQYGPTECTMTCTYHIVVSESEFGMARIGRPIWNYQIYILDENLQPVSPGMPGELYVGGIGLARAYLNSPDTTAEKFIPNPFSKVPGARLYKTGDRGRYFPDGSIDFIGRTDHQVKIRSYRIELGEIEGVLREHPSIRQAVVSIREHLLGDPRLVAYLVDHQADSVSIPQIRNFLQNRLPAYMIPSAFVILPDLPLTRTGKVDRMALPEPEQVHPERESLTAPTDLQETLAEIWSEVLHVDHVHIQDNFFEVGGHSLLAMKLVSKMSDALGCDISVQSLFLHPTIAALAESLKESLPESQKVNALFDVERADRDQASQFLQIERRPLLSLFAAGKIAPVTAAAIGYLSNEFRNQIGLSREEIVRELYDNLPRINGVIETSLGSFAIIIIPRFSTDLYEDNEDLLQRIIDAMQIAKHIGAGTVSFTGLIPSATDYGRAIDEEVSRHDDMPQITTGHATTVATVTLAIKNILRLGKRDITEETIGFLGLGSIGLATLRLMLRCLRHPVEIMLCDVYSKFPTLERIRQEIIRDLGFCGRIRILESEKEVPAQLYESTCIVGATNVPNIVDVWKVMPGTILVDDSAPHCFSPREAQERFQKYADILFTEGGVLRSPEPIKKIRYLSRKEEARMNSVWARRYFKHNEFNITGCTFSSLLSSRFPDLTRTVGPVDDYSALQHYEKLNQLGFEAADLHCEDFLLSEELIDHFRKSYGKQERR